VPALFMTGYDFPKRSVRSLYDRLRLPKKEVSALFMTGYREQTLLFGKS
jgi:hypothetical protein